MTAPVRRRPGGASAIRLTAEPEAVKTGVTLPETVSTPIEAPAERVASPAPNLAAQPVVDVPSTPAPPKTAPGRRDDDRAKEQTSLQLRRSLKRRAQTAVLRTAGYENGYRSFAALVEGALEREISRLEQEFNSGEAFPENEGGFRIGRPMGS